MSSALENLCGPGKPLSQEAFDMQRPRQQVLTHVVFALLLVGQVAIAPIEALGKQQQVAESIAIVGEVCLRREFPTMP